jgi:hypothetical protein
MTPRHDGGRTNVAPRLPATATLALLVGATLAVGSAAAPDAKAPRIVSAAMQDADRDSRADRVLITYSTRIRHPADRDGKYPFAVAGYRIGSVGAARGKTLVLALVEKAAADDTARPAIRYRRTVSKPVRDRAGKQAIAQTFKDVRAHGNAPPGPPPPPAPKDSDGDGYLDSLDCGPTDPAVHPGAADLPDLSFLDSNCDGLDGTEANAIFASPLGNDANPGTKTQPKREIQAAVAAAATVAKDVYAAGGEYGRVEARSGVGIFGAYAPESWRRGSSFVTSIAGSPEGILVDNARDVVLQWLRVAGSNAGQAHRSAYGIRGVNGSELTLQQVTVMAGNGAEGAAGPSGRAGLDGGRGGNGLSGSCDLEKNPNVDFGGSAGASPAGRIGGKGGDSGYGSGSGKAGSGGTSGSAGGPGGAGGNPGKPGGKGQDGSSGAPGGMGAGGSNSTAGAPTSWLGRNGTAGLNGEPGNGGGGGGGGGGQGGFFVDDGTGNGGGGGGGGASSGVGGGAGMAGGGSFGIYLYDSVIVVEASTITAGDGGAGGQGGIGGRSGLGGPPGAGEDECTSEVGAGGHGGRGGDGGQGGGGGGGSGGPSIGVMKAGTSSTATLTGTRVTFGTGGAGGAVGAGGTGTPAPSQPGIAAAVNP